MPQLDIIGLGMSTLDVLMRLDDMPTWDTPRGITDFGLDGGGPVATACVAASRLGARVGYVGTAGNDIVGDLKTRFMAEYGIDLSRLIVLPQPESQVVCVYVHEGSGERVFSGLKRFGETRLSPNALDREYITSARFLHLDGFYPECALQAAKWVREAGGTVSIDCGRTDGRSVSDRTVELLAHVDVLVSGAGFCRALTGHEDICAAGEEALAFGPRIVVETHGEAGSFTFTRDEQFHTPAFEVEVLDTTGAGDVFHGAYLVGLLRGWDVRLSAQFAAAVAALKCAKLGGRKGIPGIAEALEFLRRKANGG
jgi:ribokinase